MDCSEETSYIDLVKMSPLKSITHLQKVLGLLYRLVVRDLKAGRICFKFSGIIAVDQGSVTV